MQVIAPDFYSSFTGPSSAKTEERRGEGLFDSLLREEEARYREDPQPKRDYPEAARPARDDIARDERLPEERRDDEPLRETRTQREDRPVDDQDPRQEPEAAVDDGQLPAGDENHTAAAESGDGVTEPAGGATDDSPAAQIRQPQGAVAAAARSDVTAAPRVRAQSVTTATGVAAGEPGAAAPAKTPTIAAATTPAAAATTTAVPTSGDTPPAPATVAALPASAAAPAQRAAERASATATTKPANQVAAEHRQSPTQTAPAATGERPNPAAGGNATSTEPGVVVETAESLSSRPAAALGGGAATAALAQADRPAGAGRAATQSGAAEPAQSDAPQKSAAQPGQQAKVPEVALANAADKAIQVSPALGGGSSGETAGNAGGQPSSLAAPLAAGGAAPAAASQGTSFAEAIANARNTPTADPAEQIAVQVRRAQVAGQERINIKLHPAELGRIEVRLESNTDGTLRAIISAERSETLDLLQRDARGLERALQEAGVKTDSGSLNFSLRGQGQHQGQQAEGNGGSFSAGTDGGDAAAESLELPAAEAQAYRSGHDGALDIRV